MDAQLVLVLSLIILLLPLAGSSIQFLFGRIGRSVADTSDARQERNSEPDRETVDQHSAVPLSWISTLIAGLSLIGAVWLAVMVIAAPSPSGLPGYYPKAQGSIVWFDFGDVVANAVGRSTTVTLGILADNLTAVMLVVVTLISLLVHLFSGDYMRSPSMHGGRLNRYHAFLGLSTFSMIGIVLANSLLLLFIFWQLIGFSAFLLIGFRSERQASQQASFRTFITGWIGDIGLMAGIMIIYAQLGTFQLTTIFDRLGAGHLPAGSEGWLTAAGILLFCGAIGKSAQFPLNVWLSDANEAPTPATALVHAATMVPAGVYLTARIVPLLTGDAMLVIAAVGAATALIGASIALVQWDLKKVLAFSTMSQIGLMMMALGVGAYAAAVLDLVAFAIFQACLFLGSGSVIQRMRQALCDLDDHLSDPRDMRNMGGLRHRMPWTFAAMSVAALAASGVPLFSGYMAKREILGEMIALRSLAPSELATTLLVIGSVVTGVTAFLIFRMLLLVFHGRPRVPAIYDRIVESRRLMIAPLVVLAACSLWLPFGFNPFDASSGWLFKALRRPPSSAVPFASQLAEGKGSAPFPPSSLVALLATGIGIALAFRAYGRGEASERNVSWEPPRGLRALLANGWYQEAFYEKYFPVGVTTIAAKGVGWFDLNVADGAVNAVAAGAVGLARIADAFDLYVVDGIVSFLAGSTQFLGMTMRQIQTGKIQTYVVYLVLGLVVLFFLFR